MRITGADPEGAGATAVATMSRALTATAGSPPRALEQQQRQHEQPPPPSKAWCSHFSGPGCVYVNEQNLNAHALSLHRTPVPSAFCSFIRYLIYIFSCYRTRSSLSMDSDDLFFFQTWVWS